MTPSAVSPVVLVILDGWGYREETESNAIAAADTPIFDALWQSYPRTLLQASGKDVGLPKGQMGNSEVGHLNIGAGRIVPQELVRISDDVEHGTFFTNTTLVNVCRHVKSQGSRLHLLGLCSDGGVHSHLDHLIALLDLAKIEGVHDVCFHAITDGRDTLSNSGIAYLKRLQEHMQRLGIGQIVTLSGRYFAMDRDRRWDRIEKAYRVLVDDAITAPTDDPIAFLEQSYAQGITDEFIPPVRFVAGAIAPNDGVIFANFRPDRSRQLCQAFLSPEFNAFPRSSITPLTWVTFTQYDASLPVAVAYPPQTLQNLLGQVISQHGLKQFRTAETEKYAHVTYFFDGGNEQRYYGDDRELINSPAVSTYDKAPEMSADAVTDAVLRAINKQEYSLIIVNYANPDMVGHTGNYEAAIQAIAHVDRCLGRLVHRITQVGGILLVTADHGNAEVMWDEHRNPWTAHTSNPVPFLLIEGEGRKIPGHGGDAQLRAGGRLADIAPTILEILQLPKPAEMTGESLLSPSGYEVRSGRTPVKI
ncbi:MAG: 2,3-bisphosphoglycerate-independent phosphoglycerate mutase [Oscillatoriales cyanobacterium SM2_2_1]|nr:2,3-bisphosphoglycerate-independent phosphoglycerate mutase [Oscillatoriales cyanobacterium SM2_2_1]